MTVERQFLNDGKRKALVNELLKEELERAGYDSMELNKTPQGVKLDLRAEKPGMVIGKGGDNIREITSVLEDRFGFEDLSINVIEVEEPDLSANIVADKLANALERGWYFREAGSTTAERVLESGAQGVEIVFSGKLTGARSRVEKFNRGYIKHNGQPSKEIVDEGQSKAIMPLGTIGVKVKLIPPNSELPDNFEVKEDVDFDGVLEDGLDDLLVSESDESQDGDGDSKEPDSETTENETDEPQEEEVLDDVDEEFSDDVQDKLEEATDEMKDMDGEL